LGFFCGEWELDPGSGFRAGFGFLNFLFEAGSGWNFFLEQGSDFFIFSELWFKK